jgi:hypothetical protein
MQKGDEYKLIAFLAILLFRAYFKLFTNLVSFDLLFDALFL